MKTLSEKYLGKCGTAFDPDDFLRQGSYSVQILPELKGKEWNDAALGFLYGFNPSSIRVTTGLMTMDARDRRITVTVDDDGIIQEIEQEIDVGLPEGVAHGEALYDAVNFGMGSEEVKWHRNATGYILDGINGVYYAKIDGKLVPFPGTEKE